MYCPIEMQIHGQNDIYTPEKPRIHELMYWHVFPCIEMCCSTSICIYGKKRSIHLECVIL